MDPRPPEEPIRRRVDRFLSTVFPVSPLKSSVLADVKMLWVAEVVAVASSAVSGILIARWLGARDLGIAALVMALPSVVFTFLDTGSSQANIKFFGEFLAKGESSKAAALSNIAYVLDLTVSLVAFLIVVALSGWASTNLVKAEDSAGLIIVYGAAVVVRFSVPTSESLLTILGRFRLLGAMQAISSLLRVGLSLALVALGLGVAGLVWGAAIGMSLQGIGYFLIATKQRRAAWRSGRLRDALGELSGRRREVARFLVFTDLSVLVGLIPKQLDTVLLGFFRGPSEVGLYSLSRSVTALAGNVMAPLQSVVYPRFSKLFGEKNLPELRASLRRYALGVGLPLALGVLVFLPLIPVAVDRVLGPQFVPAVPAIRILLLGAAAGMAFFWLRPLVFAAGEVRMWTLNQTLFSLALLVTMVLVIPRFGLIGLAWAQAAITMCAFLAAASRMAKRRPDLLADRA